VAPSVDNAEIVVGKLQGGVNLIDSTHATSIHDCIQKCFTQAATIPQPPSGPCRSVTFFVKVSCNCRPRHCTFVAVAQCDGHEQLCDEYAEPTDDTG
jgi:hypothetical protein